MQLPTFQEIEALHRKYALNAEGFNMTFTHCCIVADIAEQLIDLYTIDVDRDLVKVACLLHDIGAHQLFDENGNIKEGSSYIMHGIKGEELLKNEGFPEVIWRFASHHTGVGLTKADIISQNLPLPEKDYLPATREERLVMYADKFHSKMPSPPHFNTFEWYREFVKQFNEDNATIFEAMAKEFGLPDLRPLSEKYGQPIGILE